MHLFLVIALVVQLISISWPIYAPMLTIIMPFLGILDALKVLMYEDIK